MVKLDEIERDYDNRDKKKDPNDMGRAEFIHTWWDYINCLEEHCDDPLTYDEWFDCIKEEARGYGENVDDEHIGWIVDRLNEDGYVR